MQSWFLCTRYTCICTGTSKYHVPVSLKLDVCLLLASWRGRRKKPVSDSPNDDRRLFWLLERAVDEFGRHSAGHPQLALSVFFIPSASPSYLVRKCPRVSAGTLRRLFLGLIRCDVRLHTEEEAPASSADKPSYASSSTADIRRRRAGAGAIYRSGERQHDI